MMLRVFLTWAEKLKIDKKIKYGKIYNVRDIERRTYVRRFSEFSKRLTKV